LKEALKGQVFYGGAAEGALVAHLPNARRLSCWGGPLAAKKAWEADLWFHVRNHDDFWAMGLADRYALAGRWERRALFWALQAALYLWAMLLHLAGQQRYYGLMLVTVLPLMWGLKRGAGGLYMPRVMLRPHTDMGMYLCWRHAVSAFLGLAGFFFLFGATYELAHTPSLHCVAMLQALIGTYFVGFFTLLAATWLRVACVFTWSSSFRVVACGLPLLEVGHWRKQLLLALLQREIDADTSLGQRLKTAIASRHRRPGEGDDEVTHSILISEIEDIVLDLGVFRLIRHVFPENMEVTGQDADEGDDGGRDRQASQALSLLEGGEEGGFDESRAAFVTARMPSGGEEVSISGSFFSRFSRTQTVRTPGRGQGEAALDSSDVLARTVGSPQEPPTPVEEPPPQAKTQRRKGPLEYMGLSRRSRQPPPTSEDPVPPSVVEDALPTVVSLDSVQVSAVEGGGADEQSVMTAATDASSSTSAPQARKKPLVIYVYEDA
jgi:hypothetical protein